MECSGEAGDDQGSGWMQVKKKHRSSSKFSLQGWVAGFPGRQGSRFLHSQPSSNVKAGTSHASCDGPPFGLKQEFANGSSAANYAYAPNEEGVGVHYLDKCVVSQENKCSSSPPPGALNGVCSDLKTGYDLDILQNNNPGVLPKFKWGDLDDGAQEPHIGCPNGVNEIGGSGNINMVARKLNDGDDPFSCISSETEPKENKLVPSTEADNISKQSLSSESRNECSDEECKEVKEVSSEDTQVKIVNETVGNENGDVHECSKDTNNDQLGSIIDFDENVHCAATKEATITLDRCGPALSCEAVASENSVAPILNEGLNSVVVSGGSDSAYKKTSLEISRESTVIASIEGSGGQQTSSILEDLSKGETMTATTAGDAGESKERFRQRLWCFLFENLNRAVDELYLLCELECDEEQMKEAVLVLEEAASDFKELNSRVEDFEKVKRLSSQSNDGPSKTMKSEHRRPHALSWEVRRMTTSPRRAEILSSSIEAFKKIHQERAVLQESGKQGLPYNCSTSAEFLNKNTSGSVVNDTREPAKALRKQIGNAVTIQVISSREKKNIDLGRPSKSTIAQNGRYSARSQSATDSISLKPTLKENADAILSGKSKKESAGPSEMEKVVPRKYKMLTEGTFEKNLKSVDNLKRQSNLSERDRDRRNDSSGIFSKSMDAWKQKRNWEDILASPFRASSRYSYSPGMSRRSVERARNLHDKLMSPEKKKKTLLDLKKEAEEKHARAMRIRSELENERLQKLRRSSKKLNRVSEWQAVRSTRLREGMHARHQRGESRHEAYLAQVARRAGDESSKVNEVRFITSLNEENKKLMLLQKHQDSELRRAEKLKDMKTKQKEDMAREEAVLERKKLIEAEKLQRLAETQRKKEEAQLRREEERKASSAAREAKAIEQMRRKEIRAKAQQEEAELLAQRLAERLSESEQRRKFYLEQIRERASMDFRDQSSPLLRRSMSKESQGKSPTNCGEDDHMNNTAGSGGESFPANNTVQQNSLKRRIKKIRQRLMALKYELPESSVGTENGGIGYRAAVGTARAKIGRWIQELQKHRQARKEGAASIGLVTAEMIKFLEGKEPEMQASRQSGLLDFISSALPASHTSKPEACQVTIYLLRLLRVVLSISVNKSYFIAQNLLPPIIPMLATALENFIKLTASSNVPSSTNSSTSKTSIENSDSVSEVLDGFLWVVAAIIGHSSSDERQLQMQDGLLELVIAYQVIHRLRDLFALYDRPQVEGSPFPSSILSSINLLVVLTSKFRTVSSIDWKSFPIEIMRVNETQEPTAIEVAYLGNSTLLSSSEKFESSISALTGSTDLVLPDVPEDRPLDQTCQVKRNNDTTSIHEAGYAPDELQCIPKETKSTVSKKDEKNTVDFGAEQKDVNKTGPNQPVAYLLSAISETGLVCLPSLLTAVLLQANNKLSSEQASYVLPSNFEETATGVLKVLNNLAIIDISFIQKMLARADLKMEFFHFMSFLLSHCTSKWGVATDQTGLLLLESLLLLGSFALFHPENQAVLRWGKSPTILHKVCDLPFVFFSDPELMPVLAGTLVAACFGCEQNKGLIQQELSIEMLLSLLKSCRNFLPSSQSCLAPDNHSVIDESLESKKFQGDTSQRSNRYNIRSGSRTQSVRGSSLVNGNKSGKTRNLRDIKGVKVSEEMSVKPNVSSLETSTNLMLHSRFPGSFIDKAEQFFSTELPV